MARVTHQGDHRKLLPCRSCGVMDKPALSLGIARTPFVQIAHCGKFLRWISARAPAERMTRRARRNCRQAEAPTFRHATRVFAQPKIRRAPGHYGRGERED